MKLFERLIKEERGSAAELTVAPYLMGAILVPALAVVIPLALTGKEQIPIKVPRGTEESKQRVQGERIFTPPVGLDQLVECGGNKTNLGTSSYPSREITINGLTAVVCGSSQGEGDQIPKDFPVVKIKIVKPRQ